MSLLLLTVMSLLLWCKEITLALLVGMGGNASDDCKTIPICEMDCYMRGPSYRCNRRGIQEVPSFPESTQDLDLSHNDIRTLNSDIFAAYLNVSSILLSNNTLVSIPEGVFRNNAAMELLDLSNNFLTSLPVAVFSNNKALDILKLANNNLTSLPDAVFKNNVELSDLDLGNNNLANIPGGVLENNRALARLLLDRNSLMTLPLDLFSSNVDLGILTVANNSLTNLPDTIFKNNVALSILNLEWNIITNLPDGLFINNKQLFVIFMTGNPIDIIGTQVFDNYNNILNSLYIDCKYCFDCDCMSVSTYQQITEWVTHIGMYKFTCRNGVALPNTVVNCLDDGLHLAVMSLHNESSCNCKDAITTESSSVDLTSETTPAMESTFNKVQHKFKTNDSSYTNTALIMSGIAASITLIPAFLVLRKFIETTRRIKHSDLADTEHNNTINDGYNFIKTIFIDEQMDKKYNNIPPISHMNTIYAGIDVINIINCNGRRGIQQHPTFESHDSVFVQHHSLHSQYNGFRMKSN